VSLTVTARAKHSAAYLELEARIRQLEADKAALAKANDQLACDLTRTVIRASQDAMWRAQADEENGRLKKANKELRHTVIRAKAEQERLRRAVVNARPRIREVACQMVRPYSPEVVLPYVSPVPHRSTANDETQQLPVIELPKPAV
jgi:hypothetical protein